MTHFSKHFNICSHLSLLIKLEGNEDKNHTTDLPTCQQGVQWLSSHFIKSYTKAEVQVGASKHQRVLALHNYQSQRISQLMSPRCREGEQRLRPHNMLSCHITKTSRHKVPGLSSELGLRTLDTGCPSSKVLLFWGPPVPRKPKRWQQRPTSQGPAGGPATPTLGSG